MARIIVEAAEALLDQEFPVLDKGFVRLVDYMGGDQRIVQAARVSYGAGTKSYREDRGLINYLMRNWHTSPFEQVVLTFHTKMPVFVARQWVRHRTARLNEISGRYSVMKDEFYVPAPEHVAFQSTDNKQGRGAALAPAAALEVIEKMQSQQRIAYDGYEGLLEQDVARELARVNLPLSMYTEWYWQIDLHNLFHFLRLRLDPHAQYEIRVYAEVMARCAEAVAPLACEAFTEHVLNALTFSAKEVAALHCLLSGKPTGLSGRAQEGFEAKLERMRCLSEEEDGAEGQGDSLSPE
jgi:thymidylate synthase (FAD)